MKKRTRKLMLKGETLRLFRVVETPELVRAGNQVGSPVEIPLAVAGNDTNSGAAMCVVQ